MLDSFGGLSPLPDVRRSVGWNLGPDGMGDPPGKSQDFQIIIYEVGW